MDLIKYPLLNIKVVFTDRSDIYTRCFTEIERLCEENCCGCQVDHPSQRQHDSVMLSLTWVIDLA